MYVSIWGALCIYVSVCSVACGILTALYFIVMSILYGNDWMRGLLIGGAYGVLSGAFAGAFLWGMQMMVIAMGAALSVH